MFSCVHVTIAQPFIVYFASGQVFQGTWNRTEVALKVLMVDEGIAPSSAVRHK
jgi:hypothetical protein